MPHQIDRRQIRGCAVRYEQLLVPSDEHPISKEKGGMCSTMGSNIDFLA